MTHSFCILKSSVSAMGEPDWLPFLTDKVFLQAARYGVECRKGECHGKNSVPSTLF